MFLFVVFMFLGLSPGGIAGIVIAAIILIILMIVGFITIAK